MRTKTKTDITPDSISQELATVLWFSKESAASLRADKPSMPFEVPCDISWKRTLHRSLSTPRLRTGIPSKHFEMLDFPN